MENRIINKNAFDDAHFINLGCREEVLKDPNKKELRKRQLNYALKWSNVYKKKVKIQFKSVDGLIHYVDSQVWAITNDFILLNDHIRIFRPSILDIRFFE